MHDERNNLNSYLLEIINDSFTLAAAYMVACYGKVKKSYLCIDAVYSGIHGLLQFSVSEPLGTNWAVPVPKLLLKSRTTPKLLLRPCFQLGNNGKNNTVLCYVVTHRLKALYKTVCSR